MPFAGMSEAGGKKSKLDDVSDDDDRAVPEELFNVVVAGDESPQSAVKKMGVVAQTNCFVES